LDQHQTEKGCVFVTGSGELKFDGRGSALTMAARLSWDLCKGMIPWEMRH